MGIFLPFPASRCWLERFEVIILKDDRPVRGVVECLPYQTLKDDAKNSLHNCEWRWLSFSTCIHRERLRKQWLIWSDPNLLKARDILPICCVSQFGRVLNISIYGGSSLVSIRFARRSVLRSSAQDSAYQYWLGVVFPWLYLKAKVIMVFINRSIWRFRL